MIYLEQLSYGMMSNEPGRVFPVLFSFFSLSLCIFCFTGFMQQQITALLEETSHRHGRIIWQQIVVYILKRLQKCRPVKLNFLFLESKVAWRKDLIASELKQSVPLIVLWFEVKNAGEKMQLKNRKKIKSQDKKLMPISKEKKWLFQTFPVSSIC